MKIKAYTDGCWLPNGGRGWACVFTREGAVYRLLSGYCKRGSSFGVELLAIIKAMEHTEDMVTIHTDVESVVERSNAGELGAMAERKKNRNLWRRLARIAEKRDVEFVHVSGMPPEGKKWYDMAHCLARVAAEKQEIDVIIPEAEHTF